MKGRSLEELDYMFESKIATRKFRSFDSTQLLEEKREQHHTEAQAQAIVENDGFDKKHETEILEKV